MITPMSPLIWIIVFAYTAGPAFMLYALVYNVITRRHDHSPGGNMSDRWFSRTTHAWRRLKLLWAELLVISTMKGDHTFTYRDFAEDAANSIRDYREMYYPEPRP